jgi:hypothetical protein
MGKSLAELFVEAVFRDTDGLDCHSPYVASRKGEVSPEMIKAGEAVLGAACDTGETPLDELTTQ